MDEYLQNNKAYNYGLKTTDLYCTTNNNSGSGVNKTAWISTAIKHIVYDEYEKKKRECICGAIKLNWARFPDRAGVDIEKKNGGGKR